MKKNVTRSKHVLQKNEYTTRNTKWNCFFMSIMRTVSLYVHSHVNNSKIIAENVYDRYLQV